MKRSLLFVFALAACDAGAPSVGRQAAAVQVTLNSDGTESPTGNGGTGGTKTTQPPPPPTLADYAGGIFWDGFTEKWTYNHRINRLGDWIDSWTCGAVCAGTVKHAAASGSGADTASFDSHFTMVNGGAHFASGTITVAPSGDEGTLSSDSTVTTATLPASMRGLSRYEVLLNGYDLVAVSRANKVEHFDIKMGNPTISGTVISIPMSWSFVADCSSPECLIEDAEAGFTSIPYQYSLRVHYIVVGGDFAVTKATAPPHLGTWTDSTDTVTMAGFHAPATVVGSAGFAAAALGVKHFTVDAIADLSVESAFNPGFDLHMLGWAQALVPSATPYAPSTGAYSFDARLGFDNWSTAMFTKCPSTLGVPDCYAMNGTDAESLELELLQFNGATSSVGSVSSSISWPGGGISADTASATHSEVVLFD